MLSWSNCCVREEAKQRTIIKHTNYDAMTPWPRTGFPQASRLVQQTVFVEEGESQYSYNLFPADNNAVQQQVEVDPEFAQNTSSKLNHVQSELESLYPSSNDETGKTWIELLQSALGFGHSNATTRTEFSSDKKTWTLKTPGSPHNMSGNYLTTFLVNMSDMFHS
jgi:hypothetical protein